MRIRQQPKSNLPEPEDGVMVELNIGTTIVALSPIAMLLIWILS